MPRCQVFNVRATHPAFGKDPVNVQVEGPFATQAEAAEHVKHAGYTPVAAAAPADAASEPAKE